MKKVYSLFFFLLIITLTRYCYGQTTLADGDVAVIAFGPSSTDHFAIVLLKDIAAGTVINFTDNGLASSTTGATGEGYLTYTALSKQCAGTVLVWTNGMSIAGTGWSSNNPANFSLNASGEQLFVFQGNGTNGTSITTNFGTQSGTTSDNEWAAQTGVTLLYGIQTDISWITSGGTSASQSYQPSTSILPAIDVIQFTSKSDVYLTTTTLSGTQSTILTTLNNTGSYTTSTSSVTFPAYTAFTVSILGVTGGTICYSGSTSLIASGYSTYSWAPNTSLSATTGSTVSASPTITTTYTVTGTSTVGCTANTTGVVTFINNVNVTGASAAADNGQLTILWANPGNCFDQIMVVGKSTSSVLSTLSGDGTSYSPDQFFTGGSSGNNLSTSEYDVYQGTGTSVTVFGLTNGTVYDFKIFTKYGTNWSNGVTVTGTPAAQNGDFQTRAGVVNVNWSGTTTWQTFSGGTWSNSSSHPASSSVNVTILNGTKVIVDNSASPYKVKNLVVQSGGQLYCNTTSGTPLYVDLYGNLTCNGIIGNSPSKDDIGIDVDGVNCVIDGAGTLACTRIRKNNTDNTTTNLNINTSVAFLWNTSTQSAFLYNNQAATNFNVTTAIGTTLSCTNTSLDVAIDGSDGTATDERGGTYTINGTLTLAGILHLTTQNITNACTFIINGTVNAATVDASASNKTAAPSILTINSGGQLNITGTSGISPFSTTHNTYNLNTGSTVQYSASGAQTIETGMGAYYNLTCSGSGNKTPNGDVTVNGDLLVNAAALNASSTTNLTTAGNITLQSSGTTTSNCYDNLKIATSGTASQTFNGNGQTIQCNNLTSVKSAGGISLTGSSQTPLNIKNTLSVNYTGAALLADNGNTITIGNDAELGSGASNFAFTGTMKFISLGSNTSHLSDFSGSLVCPAHLYNLTVDAASGSSNDGLNIFPSPSGGQSVYVDGAVTIANTNSVGTNFNPNGNIINVKGNWTTYSHAGLQASVNGNCNIIFNGTGGVAQTISSSDYEVFYNLQLSNGNGLTLSSSIHVTNQLTLSNGIISTGTNEVDVTATAASSVTSYGPSSYVQGNLRRNVASTGSYDFPVGTSANYELATVKLNSSSGITNILGTFTSGLPATLPNASTCFINSTPIASMLNAGYWTITPDAYTAVNYDITLNEKGYSNFSGIAGQIGLIKRHDAADSWHGSNANGGYDNKQGIHSDATQSVSGGTAVAKRTAVQGFSDYGIGFGNAVLPITLSSFTAVFTEGKTVDVQWTTETEENTDHFEIQRSSDAVNFETVGKTNAAGNSESVLNYQWTDKQPLTGVSYYRLKEVDIDGYDGSYSNIQPIVNNNAALNNLVVYPVPSTDMLNVHFVSAQQGVANVQIVNSLGQVYYNGTMSFSGNGSDYSMDINRLSSGNYFIRITGAVLGAL